MKGMTNPLTCTDATDAVSYQRLSPRPDGAYDLGLERQHEEIERVATYRKLRVVKEYIDEDRSAFKGLRPAYQAMMTAIRAGHVTALVAYDLDRLYRQPRELEDLIDLADAGLLVITAQGEIDLSNSNGRAMARIVVAMASKSSEDESRRMKLKHAELANKGLPAGGGRPFGYQADKVTIEPDEARLIRLALDRVLAGGSLRSIVNEWTAQGVVTTRGKSWSQFALKHVLTSPRTAGLRSTRGIVVGPAVWPGIITLEEHTRVRTILFDPRRNMSGGAGIKARKYLLRGIATCGVCGGRLIARPSATHRAMVCATGESGGCGKIRVRADTMEEWLVDRVLIALDSPELTEATAVKAGERGDAELVATIARDEASLEQLARDHYLDHVISRPQFMAASSEIEARLEGNRQKLAAETPLAVALAECAGTGANLRGTWASLSLDRQRAIVAAVVERVVVNPGVRGRNLFDPSRFDVRWRF